MDHHQIRPRKRRVTQQHHNDDERDDTEMKVSEHYTGTTRAPGGVAPVSTGPGLEDEEEGDVDPLRQEGHGQGLSSPLSQRGVAGITPSPQYRIGDTSATESDDADDINSDSNGDGSQEDERKHGGELQNKLLDNSDNDDSPFIEEDGKENQVDRNHHQRGRGHDDEGNDGDDEGDDSDEDITNADEPKTIFEKLAKNPHRVDFLLSALTQVHEKCNVNDEEVLKLFQYAAPKSLSIAAETSSGNPELCKLVRSSLLLLVDILAKFVAESSELHPTLEALAKIFEKFMSMEEDLRRSRVPKLALIGMRKSDWQQHVWEHLESSKLFAYMKRFLDMTSGKQEWKSIVTLASTILHSLFYEVRSGRSHGGFSQFKATAFDIQYCYFDTVLNMSNEVSELSRGGRSVCCSYLYNLRYSKCVNSIGISYIDFVCLLKQPW